MAQSKSKQSTSYQLSTGKYSSNSSNSETQADTVELTHKKIFDEPKLTRVQHSEFAKNERIEEANLEMAMVYNNEAWIQ